jgi:hypothetical protein
MTEATPLSHHRGEAFAGSEPAKDPVLYGHADIEPKGAFEARSLQTFTLTYTAGRYGLDDTGAIKVALRFSADGGPLQMDDPAALNYVTAKTSTGVDVKLTFSPLGHSVRPWYQALTVTVSKGCLREGDTITVTLGDTAGGSPGLRLQSMCETAFMWKVLADVCATGQFVPIAASPTIRIVPGPPAVWKAVLPTLRRPGDTFRLGLKAEDRYGNPSDKVDATVRLIPSRPVGGLPETVTLAPGDRAAVIDGLTAEAGDPLTITVCDQTGAVLCVTNPLRIQEGARGYWGDMHGQSGESVGINTAREYFVFARDLAFLDATSHQANDFQINGAFWAHINDLTAEFHEDGRFLTLPGYEWSGNTGVGGDRNVYFRSEGRTIRRSSHALIADRSEIHTDAPTARDLFDALQGEDCVVYAHIGGRPADVAYAHDERLETAMEIHSAWGTFEWLMDDCFRQGYRVGVVANSDGHKGRPGASYPGTSDFGAYGGLTCFLMDSLDRDAVFDCLRTRRHYATTGDRIHLDVSVAVDGRTLAMGDIAETGADAAAVSVTAHARAPIERIDILRGMETAATVRNPAPFAGRRRVRVLWRGALVKGRGAKARWAGTARVEGASILETREINAWNPDRALRRDGDSVSWDSVTAGNFGAFDLWLSGEAGGVLTIETNFADARIDLDNLAPGDDYRVDAGGMDLELRVFALPDSLAPGPLTAEAAVALNAAGDTPLWCRVTTEDGFQAWSSPVYLTRPR